MRWMIVTDYLRRVCRASEGEAEHSRCDCPAERKVARTLSYSYTAAGLPRYVSRLVPGVRNKAETGDVALKIINCGTGIHAREITGVSLLPNLPAHWVTYTNLHLAIDPDTNRELDRIPIRADRTLIVGFTELQPTGRGKDMMLKG